MPAGAPLRDATGMRRATHLALAALAAVAKAEWEESEHPRDKNGEFTGAGGGGEGTGDNGESAGPAFAPSEKQLRALRSYSQKAHKAGNYVEINNALAGQVGGKLEGARLTKAQNMGREINAAISASSLARKTELHRGGSMPLTAEVGSVISTPRLVSATTDERIARSFVRVDYLPPGHGPAYLQITAPKGARVLNLGDMTASKFDDEKEHLFGSNQQFTISKIDRSGDMPVYHLDVLTEAAVAKAEWDESQHPRDKDGEFANAGGSASASTPKPSPAPAPALAPAPKKVVSQFGKRLEGKEASNLNSYVSGNNSYGVGFQEVNDVVSGRGDKHNLSDGALAKTNEIAASLRSSIDASTLKKDMVLYRGSNIPKGLAVGAQIGTHGFTSTTTSQSVAEEFADKGRSSPSTKAGETETAIFSIRAPKGMGVLDVAASSDPKTASSLVYKEREHIFHDKVKFRVVSDEGRNEGGHRLLTLEPVLDEPAGVAKALAALAAVGKAEWDESQHPRDENGKLSQGAAQRRLTVEPFIKGNAK